MAKCYFCESELNPNTCVNYKVKDKYVQCCLICNAEHAEIHKQNKVKIHVKT